MSNGNYYEVWLEYAKEDLHGAMQLNKGKKISKRLICYHCEQAAEKAIKAVMIFLNIDFPFSHDIKILCNTMENKGYKIPESVKDASVLTEYATSKKYPGDDEPITGKEVKYALKSAKSTLKWALKVTKDKNLLLK